MRKTAIALGITGLLALGLVLALSSLAAQVAGPTFDPLAYEREQQAIARMQALAPVETFTAAAWALLPLIAAMILLVLATAGGVVSLARFRHERQPDARGLLPLRSDDADAARLALGGFHQAHIEAARRPNVPMQLHYSHRADGRGAAELPALQPAPELPAALPGVIDLAALDFQPSRERILLGLAEGGAPITVPMRALWHIGTAGPTGAGKSNIARLILPQLQAIGAKVAIIDPKWTPFDAESGEDWRPIGERLFLPAASGAGAIRDTIGYFHDELDRRLELRRKGERVGSPLFLYADEFTTITADVKDADEDVARLARLGRGVGIFLLITAHDLLVKNGAGDTRDQLRTGYYLGGDTKTGSVLLDLPQRAVLEREGDLAVGVAMLRSAATSPARLVRVPYASNAGVALLLGAASGAASEERRIGFRVPTHEAAAEVGSEAAATLPLRPRQNAANWTPEELRIVALLAEGKGPREIVIALWGVKGGDAYTQAAAIVTAVIARLARGERP